MHHYVGKNLVTTLSKEGIPIQVFNRDDNTIHTTSLSLFEYLNDIGSRHGIGRLDMTENRFVGIKSRGVYETPGGTILYAAHADLCGLTMDREVMRLYQQFALKIADLIYNGFWFSPEMDILMTAAAKTQENVNGTVTVKLYKGMAYPVARMSPTSLYNADLSSMDISGGYNQIDVAGFIKINAIRLTAWHAIQKKKI
jgi:argininosuccinate synthase